jgi:hypothetical protein
MFDPVPLAASIALLILPGIVHQEDAISILRLFGIV